MGQDVDRASRRTAAGTGGVGDDRRSRERPRQAAARGRRARLRGRRGDRDRDVQAAAGEPRSRARVHGTARPAGIDRRPGIRVVGATGRIDRSDVVARARRHDRAGACTRRSGRPEAAASFRRDYADRSRHCDLRRIGDRGDRGRDRGCRSRRELRDRDDLHVQRHRRTVVPHARSRARALPARVRRVGGHGDQRHVVGRRRVDDLWPRRHVLRRDREADPDARDRSDLPDPGSLAQGKTRALLERTGGDRRAPHPPRGPGCSRSSRSSSSASSRPSRPTRSASSPARRTTASPSWQAG